MEETPVAPTARETSGAWYADDGGGAGGGGSGAPRGAGDHMPLGELPKFDSDVRVALYRAMCDEDWAKVHDLLIIAKDTPIDYVNDKHNTVLHAAVQFSAPFAFIARLLERGADPNAANVLGATPLHFAAAFRAPYATFEALLNRGADPNRLDTYGVTPLHVAVEKGSPVRVIELLLRKGGDPNVANNAGFTAMHVAAEHNPPVSVVRALISSGADVNRKTKKGSTPLDIALGHHGSSAQLVGFLRAAGDFRAMDLGCCAVS